MNLIHFNSPEEGLFWIAVLTVTVAVLWIWDYHYPGFRKRRRH